MTSGLSRYLKLGMERYGVVREILAHPLSADRKAKTLFDYVSWNLARKAMNHKVVLPLPNDLQIIVPNQSNFATGL